MALTSRLRRWQIGSLALFLVAGVALCLPSCGSGRKAVYQVHGQVFAKNGQPAADAFVVFHPVDAADGDAHIPSAYVNEDGSFSLTTYTQGDGAPVGEYIVTIEWRPRVKSAFDPNRHGRDKLEGRYSNVAKSKLRFTIEKKSSDLPPIQLD